jgi:hypothetical protein
MSTLCGIDDCPGFPKHIIQIGALAAIELGEPLSDIVGRIHELGRR